MAIDPHQLAALADAEMLRLELRYVRQTLHSSKTRAMQLRDEVRHLGEQVEEFEARERELVALLAVASPVEGSLAAEGAGPTPNPPISLPVLAESARAPEWLRPPVKSRAASERR